MPRSPRSGVSDAATSREALTSRARHVADDIVAKAGELFDAKGYSETSLQDVADTVGIARPSLYHYFSSKEEILVRIVEGTIEARDGIIERVTTMAGGPRERLVALVTEVGGTTRRNPAGLRLVLNAGGALPADLHRRELTSRRSMFELVSRVLADGMRQGVFRPADERATAATIIAALSGLQYADIGGVSMEPAQAAERMATVLVDGVCLAPGAGAAGLDEAIAALHENLRTLEWHARALRDGDGEG